MPRIFAKKFISNAMRVYLDNAATTPMDPQVIEAMHEVMTNCYGNPSSIHTHGRQAKTYIEKARKSIAQLLHVSPAEIFFTGGGTEADNLIIRKAVCDLGVTTIITSSIEHHAVGHTAEELACQLDNVKVEFVHLDAVGKVDYAHLEQLLQQYEQEKILVSLMHANNEIGTMIDLQKVSALCKQYNALFHSDTVQTMAHFRFNLQETPVDFITCSAHKFHGPKGSGFVYVNSNNKLSPMITGGAQERNMRAGTENIYGIVGLQKAFEIAHEHMEEHQAHVRGLKNYMITQLQKEIPGVQFNGDISENSLYTVLNVQFPHSSHDEMFLMRLDIMGVCASGGSACSSGSNIGSHVLAALNVDKTKPNIRFSFSRFTTKEEIDFTINVLKSFY